MVKTEGTALGCPTPGKERNVGRGDLLNVDSKLGIMRKKVLELDDGEYSMSLIYKPQISKTSKFHTAATSPLLQALLV